ncbi:hypothetical protein D3C73_573720 [compost metagenome]
MLVVIEGQIPGKPAQQGEGVGQGLADVEADAGGSVGIDRRGVDQGYGLVRAIARQGQGGGAGQGLAVPQGVGDDKLTLAKQILAEGEVVGEGHLDAVTQGIARRDPGLAAVDGEADLFLQGDGAGGEADGVTLAGEVDAGGGRRQIPAVERGPLTAGGGGRNRDLYRIPTVGVDHLLTVGIGLGYVELDQGIGGGGEAAVGHGKGLDEEAVAVDGRRDEGRVGEDTTIREGDRGEDAILPRGDGGDLDGGGQGLADDDVVQGLAIGRDGRQDQGVVEVGAGRRFAFGHVEAVLEADDGRFDHKTVQVPLDQAGIVEGIAEGVIAILETAANADGQIRRRRRVAGVGQIAQLGGDLDRNIRLTLIDAAKGDLDDHQGITGTQADVSRPDDEGVAAVIDREGMGGIARSVEHHAVGLECLAQIAGLDEADPIVSILAGAGQVEIQIGGIAGLARLVADGDSEFELLAQQDIGAAKGQAAAGVGVGEQPIVTLHRRPIE